MKELLTVGNWKMQMTSVEATSYFEKIGALLESLSQSNNKIVICPPFLSVPDAAKYIRANSLPIALGVQDVAPFEDGEYTGEVSAHQAAEFVKYAIIGHSERRKNFGENDEMLSKKVATAINAGLIPIFCIQDENTPIPQGVSVVAYEPPFAIGSDKPDTPENAEMVAKTVKGKYPDLQLVLYGGSVNPENVGKFTAMENISGVLVGRSSRDPESFASIVKNA